jgi:hypothetical protein
MGNPALTKSEILASLTDEAEEAEGSPLTDVAFMSTIAAQLHMSTIEESVDGSVKAAFRLVKAVQARIELEQQEGNIINDEEDEDEDDE